MKANPPAGVVDRVAAAIRAGRLIGKGDRVLIGVSGGPDSVALWHLLLGLQDARQISVLAVHVDHQLRPSSTSDAEAVQQLGQRLQAPVVVVRRNVRAESRDRGWSLEDGARRIRYEVFRDLARARDLTRIAVAHTADDQAETVVMRMVRGTGLTGLTAIPSCRRVGPGDGVMIIRPLLGVWRREIMAYLQAHDLPYCLDETNADVQFLRNRIRVQLLPLLEQQYNPNIKTLLAQLAEQCQTDTAFLQDEARRYWRRLVKRPPSGSLAIRITGFLRQPQALQRQLMRLAIHDVQGDLTGFEFRHWLEIERLFRERPVGTILDLPNGTQLERQQAREEL